jgi:hypothetical protein
MRALAESERFVFSLLTRDYWQYMHRKLEEAMERGGMQPEDYLAWLQERNIKSDSWPRRLEFVAWRNAQDRD